MSSAIVLIVSRLRTTHFSASMKRFTPASTSVHLIPSSHAAKRADNWSTAARISGVCFSTNCANLSEQRPHVLRDHDRNLLAQVVKRDAGPALRLGKLLKAFLLFVG